MAESPRIWLLSRDTLDDERMELERLGVPVEYLSWNDISIPSLATPEVLRWMMVPNAMVFQLSFVEELERAGTRVINCSRAVQACDKVSIYFLWQRYLQEKIAMPATILTSNVDQALQFIADRGQAIFKPIAGQGGEGIIKLDSTDGRNRSILEKLLSDNHVLFLQEFLESTHEIRTVVAGGEVIAQYARFNAESFHGLASGGTILPVNDERVNLDLDNTIALQETAMTIGKITGLDLFAADALVNADHQPVLLEWNPFFAYGQTKKIHIKIASRIAEFIIAISRK
ncbi:MAG TPA: YheC/YheD family protein [Candidatus Lokiarchaeia archaeon]|nr:YheC/YheD family protein [Candidatus Lokiarchaeia archaeon]